MLCHSVFSWRWPPLSRHLRLVARVKLATGWPDGVDRTSGSRPRLPTRITLLIMLPFSSTLGNELRYHTPCPLLPGPGEGARRRPPCPPSGGRTENVRLILQRVSSASVTVDGETVGKIGRGVLVLVGVLRGDGPQQVAAAAEKLAGLRLFDDSEG